MIRRIRQVRTARLEPFEQVVITGTAVARANEGERRKRKRGARGVRYRVNGENAGEAFDSAMETRCDRAKPLNVLRIRLKT